MDDKIVRPKLKARISPVVMKLVDEAISVNAELRKISDFYKKYRDQPASKNYSEAIELRSSKYPVLQKKLGLLLAELNKERFNAATGNDLAVVEKEAIAYGDENSWLLLLHWNIVYLEKEQLRALIYNARKKRTLSDLRFLKEVAHIIKNPRKPHGNAKIAKLDAVLDLYDPSKTNEQMLSELSERGVEVSDKYMLRIGLSKKK